MVEISTSALCSGRNENARPQSEEARRRQLAGLKPFPKGVSGNPGGVSKWDRRVKQAAKKLGPEAIEELAAIGRDPNADSRARVAAWNSILDRGFGKPKANVRLENELGPNALAALSAMAQKQALPAPGDDAKVIEAEPVPCAAQKPSKRA